MLDTTITIAIFSAVALTFVICGMMWERWTWLAKAHDDSDHVWKWGSIHVKLIRLSAAPDKIFGKEAAK